MCNPRRVEVTATRQVREAWEREVERAAEVTGIFSGEARVCQALDASVGAPALMALQNLLASGFEGWEELEDGSFRHEVEGGHVVYRPDDRSLEIVAVVTEELRETGIVHERLSGVVEEQIEARAEGQYYDDGWGGKTEERARQEAQEAADANIDASLRESLVEAAELAEKEQDGGLRRRAEQVAGQRLEQRGSERQAELSRCAREQLQEVGVRARQAFHHLLAHAYRDALTAMARRRGVSNDAISTRESEEYLEIEFQLPD